MLDLFGRMANRAPNIPLVKPSWVKRGYYIRKCRPYWKYRVQYDYRLYSKSGRELKTARRGAVEVFPLVVLLVGLFFVVCFCFPFLVHAFAKQAFLLSNKVKVTSPQK